MINFDHCSSRPQGLILSDLLHGQNGAAWNIKLIENFHGFKLCLGHGPSFNAIKDRLQVG